MSTPSTAIQRRPHAVNRDLRGWSLNPDRTHLITDHAAEPNRLTCWALGSDGTLASENPVWTMATPAAGWRVLGWASRQHLVLWRRAQRSVLWVLDVTAGSTVSRFEVLGRPVHCRFAPNGAPLALVVVSQAGGPELFLYQADLGSYDRVAGTHGVQGVGAWDSERAVFAVDTGDTRFYRYDRSGCADLEVPTPVDIRVVATAGCAAGRIGMTGADTAGRMVPGVLDLVAGTVDWFRDQAGTSATELAASGTRLLTRTWSEQRFTYRVLDASGNRVGELNPEPGLATEVQFARDEHHLLGWHQSPASPATLTRWTPPSLRAHPVGPGSRVDSQPGMRWRHRWLRDVPEWVFERPGGEHAGTVLFLHGGPRGQLKQEYDPVIDALVSAGWVVVGPNYPGSSGYGSAYRELGRGDWGGVDAVAIQRRLETLHAEADGRPVAVYGQSYGGYLALSVAAALPHLVAKVAVWAPVTDLLRLSAGVTGVRKRWLDGELGNLRLDDRRLWERSPASQARVLAGTRLLIGHGREDNLCPVDQSRHLVNLIMRYRQDASVHYMEDPGGHAPGDWQPWSRAVVDHFRGRSGPDGP